MRKILVLSLGWEQEPMIFRLLNEDVQLYGVHYSEDYNHDIPFEEVLITDLRNINEVLQFAERVKPHAVISDQDDYAHFAQAVIAEKFGLRGPKVKHAQIASNKYLQRLKCKETGIKHPEFELVHEKAEVKHFGQQHGYPIILKPIDNRGSFGVVKITNEADIESAFFESLMNSHSRLMIVEKFISGVEITVDGYCIDGKPQTLAIASKTKLNKELQVSVDIIYPAELEEATLSLLREINEKVIESLGYSFGMTHAEYIVKDNGEIYLVEAANRGGGCYTSCIIAPNVSGFDIVGQYINDVMGYKHVKKNVISPGEVILKFFTFPSGKVKQVLGVEEVEKQDTLAFMLNLKSGDEIKDISSDANRHGFVIVKSPTGVRQKCLEIMQKINIEYYE